MCQMCSHIESNCSPTSSGELPSGILKEKGKELPNVI